ncbi:MAG TPA: hypothetical protein VMW24_24880 [Sedimentisphaerales bacterium]|nr:hypothetical protein [Sedimentisphaerales bacterium]
MNPQNHNDPPDNPEPLCPKCGERRRDWQERISADDPTVLCLSCGIAYVLGETDCPACDGTGFVTGDGPPDDDEKKCPVCKGSGGLDADITKYIGTLQEQILQLAIRIANMNEELDEAYSALGAKIAKSSNRL